MNVPFFVAGRYIRSKRNRGFISFVTLIAIIGVALGVASLIITLAILEGFEKTIKENVVSFTAHMQLFGFSNQPLQNPDFALERVKKKFPEVKKMSPYVSREAMIRSEAEIDGILLKGIDPENDISAAQSRLIKGSYDFSDRQGRLQPIIIGKQLAERLEVEIGQPILVFALGGLSLTMSETRVMQFEVVGIFETGMAEYDATYAYVNITSAQRFFQLGRAVTGFDILVDDLEFLKRLVDEIPADLGYPYYARTMHQMYRNLFAWVELQKKPVPIILGLIIIVAIVNIIGTLLMMVMEKSKDIGVLRTLGANQKLIQRIFLAQGMLIGFVGTAFGNILAYGLIWLEMEYNFISLPSGIYYMSVVPFEPLLYHFFLVSGIALILCYLCSLIPAKVATRLDPILLLRFAR